jgi:hypothetical protein
VELENQYSEISVRIEVIELQQREAVNEEVVHEGCRGSDRTRLRRPARHKFCSTVATRA